MGGLINVMEPCCAAGGGGGGGGISIGDSIGGGTAQSVPFIDASGNLAQEPTFNYSTIENILSAQIITASNTVSGNTVRANAFLFSADQDTFFVRFGPQRVGLGSQPSINDAVLEIGGIRKKAYTVGTLPASPLLYDECLVTDALTPARDSPVVAGGAVVTGVRWVSPNWLVM